MRASYIGIAGAAGDFFFDNRIKNNSIDVNEFGMSLEFWIPVMTEDTDSTTRTSSSTQQFIADHPFVFYIKVNNIVVSE